MRDNIRAAWPDGPPLALFDEILTSGTAVEKQQPAARTPDDPVTIIYTSGTSGERKGVILDTGNVTYMLGCVRARLDLLMAGHDEPDQVFHYLPFCFAGSWILLLSCLSRKSVLTLSTDLNKLADEMRLAAPNYFLNVPLLLERVRVGIEDQLAKKGGIALTIFTRGKAGWFRAQSGKSGLVDNLWIALAVAIVFPAIKKKLGPALKALICGSAPLAKETQLFFMMIGIPVLQVYGLTETTAICTMDHPNNVTPGRVGLSIPGIEMRLGENDEILVRGPNIFPGYWNRPADTARAIQGGWFYTGDQGEIDDGGNWAIIGRIKNLIIPASGHNVAPEPIEEVIVRNLPGAQQCVLIGNGKSFLTALVTGDVTDNQVADVLESVNSRLPHYKRVRAFHITTEPFTMENGLLTANGKLKRDAITSRYREQIDDLYRAKNA
jgi:long-chain acyl-CoA synthetase